MRRVTRKGKIQFVLIAELLQLFYGISTDTENSCAELVQFFFGITELVRLARSTRGIRFGEKEKDKGTTLERVQRNSPARIVRQGKARSVITHLEHK